MRMIRMTGKKNVENSHENDQDDWENKGGDEKANMEASETVPSKVKGTDHRTT